MRFLPNNFPARYVNVVFFDITENQVLAFELVGPNLARANITMRSGDFWQVHNLFSLHIDLIAATICEDSISGGNFFIKGCERRITPFGSIGVF